MNILAVRDNGARFSRILELLFISVLAIFLAGCGGGGSDGGSGNDTGGQDTRGAPFTDPAGADLSAVTLAASEAAPMEWVEVLGLPAGVGQDDVHIKYLPEEFDGAPWSSEEALIMPLYIEIDDDSDSVFLAAPLFELDGAAAKMVVSDGKSHSGLLNLKLLALPARRTGAIDELTAALEDLLKAGTEALGKDYPQEWEGWRDQSYNQIPEYLLPLALFWHETANPENPNALVNRSYNAEEQELLERILAHRTRQGNLFVETVENLAQATRDGDTLLDEAADTTPVMTSSAPVLSSQKIVSQSLTQVTASSSPPTRELNGQSFVPINGPGALALQLQAYKAAKELSEDIEMATDIAEIGVTVVTVASTGGAAGAVRVGASLAGKSATKSATSFLATSAARLAGYSQMAQWFLPCCIPDMQVELDPADGRIMAEDEVANQVRLVNATGRVESAGVNLVEKAFDQIVGAVQGQFDEVAGNAVNALAESSIPSDLITNASDPLFEEISDRLPDGANLVLVWEDIDLIGVEPQRWLTHDAETFGGAGIPIIEQASTSSSRYEFKLRVPEAFERQSSLLRFRTNTEELPAPEAIDTRQINLEYIDIEFDPSVIRIDENSPDVTVVTLTVKNANDMDIDLPLQLDPDFGTIVQTGTVDNGVYTFTYTKPAGELPASGIATVTATSIAQAGIRAPNNDPPLRSANLLISPLSQPVDITPRSACLSSGEGQQFAAVDPETGEPVEANWSADRGSVSSSGFYTAPGGDGPATVTASTETNSSSAQITVGNCTCYFRASLNGPGVSVTVTRQGFSFLALGRDNTTYDQLRFFGQGSSPSNATVLTMGLDPSLPIGSSGPTTTSTRNLLFLGGEALIFFGPEGEQLPPLTVDITSRTPIAGGSFGSVSMAGQISGPVNVSRSTVGEDPIRAFLDVQFNGIYTIPTAGPALNCNPDF